jgi:tRNA G18 (ribose-2'-O)-methylase SpoU
VGAIFRTADGAGVGKIYLTGYTPAPIDQFKRPNGEIKKTALGAEETVAWEKRENILELITKLKKSGLKIWALEQADKSVNYREAKLTAPTALIVGNETEGIEPEILNLCDQVIEIPMRGAKESLNAAVATGIAVFRILE